MQYDWQSSYRVSRHQLAGLIQNAEREIATTVGYWPAMVWISDEWQEYPDPHRAEFYGSGETRRGDWKPMTLKWGHVQYGGQRATTLLPIANVTRNADVDADGDGYRELAQFTITGVATDFNICQLRAYFKVYALADAAN
jgi:hypothetical protein